MLKRNVKCIIAHNRDGFFCVPLSSAHRPAAQAVLAGDVYEPDTLGFMVDRCGYRDVVLAGAYFGDFVPAISRSIAPSAMVWAFEPNPENFTCASITLRLNGIQNVSLSPYGLWRHAGALQMCEVDANGRALGGASFLFPDQQAPPHSAGLARSQAKVVSLDEHLDPRREIGIIQFDLEGCEQSALSGAMATIQRCRPVIILETVPDAAWVAEHLVPLGYRELTRTHLNTVFAAG